MATLITVPDIGQRPVIRININGKVYDLTPGETVEVPDEVAAYFASISGLTPKEDPNAADKRSATIEQVKEYVLTAIELPLGGSTGDFLRMGENGPEWYSLPDAEDAEV